MSDDDVNAINALINRQFKSLSWTEDQDADWDGFQDDFLDNATLYPSARPLQAHPIAAFVERMQVLAEKQLTSFSERSVGKRIIVFKNIAVAMVGCEQIENDGQPAYTAEAMLLVKDDGKWKIAAQGWERGDNQPIPLYLVE